MRRSGARIHVVMGVAGSGKSVIGAAFARAVGVSFVDGDDYHSAESVARMAAGIPLTDEDRSAWLRLLADRLREAKRESVGLVMACSALKRAYRDVLRGGAPDLQLVFLDGPRSLIAERLASRRGHFMPESLLESQLETLEPPTPDENAWVVDVRASPAEIVAELVALANAD